MLMPPLPERSTVLLLSVILAAPLAQMPHARLSEKYEFWTVMEEGIQLTTATMSNAEICGSHYLTQLSACNQIKSDKENREHRAVTAVLRVTSQGIAPCVVTPALLSALTKLLLAALFVLAVMAVILAVPWEAKVVRPVKLSVMPTEGSRGA